MFDHILLISINLSRSEAADGLTQCPKLKEYKSCLDIEKHGLECIWRGKCVSRYRSLVGENSRILLINMFMTHYSI